VARLWKVAIWLIRAAWGVLAILGLIAVPREAAGSIKWLHWSWLQLIFVAYILSSLVVVVDLAVRIYRVEEQKTKILVSRRYEGRKAWLEIINDGEHDASITVTVNQVRLTDKSPIHYDAGWRGQRDAERKLLSPGGRGDADIASVDSVRSDGRRLIQFLAANETIQASVVEGGYVELDVVVVASPKMRRPYRETLCLVLGEDGTINSLNGKE
jgi:hypothetical protein